MYLKLSARDVGESPCDFKIITLGFSHSQEIKKKTHGIATSSFKPGIFSTKFIVIPLFSTILVTQAVFVLKIMLQGGWL